MLAVRQSLFDWKTTHFTNEGPSKDECEGCQVHNLLCDKGTGRLHGFTTDGHFAEYSLSDYRNAMVLPDGMDMVSAAPLFCAGITGVS
jgi:D-arabinose 1-dehydrogenase-like Zn-dependent alcohol dehydrogenase